MVRTCGRYGIGQAQAEFDPGFRHGKFQALGLHGVLQAVPAQFFRRFL